jgi:hypothetical protein
LFTKEYKSFRGLPSLESIDIDAKGKGKGKRPSTTNLEASTIRIDRLGRELPAFKIRNV